MSNNKSSNRQTRKAVKQLAREIVIEAQTETESFRFFLDSLQEDRQFWTPEELADQARFDTQILQFGFSI